MGLVLAKLNTSKVLYHHGGRLRSAQKQSNSHVVDATTDELGVDTLATMAKVKQALDPHNLMNPGKMLEQQRDHETGRLRVCCGSSKIGRAACRERVCQYG